MTNADIIKAWEYYERERNYFSGYIALHLDTLSDIDLIPNDEADFISYKVWYRIVGPYAYIVYATQADAIQGPQNFDSRIDRSQMVYTVLAWIIYFSNDLSLDVYETYYTGITGRLEGNVETFALSTFISLQEKGEAYMYSEEDLSGKDPSWFLTMLSNEMEKVPNDLLYMSENFIELVLPDIRERMSRAIISQTDKFPARLGEEIATRFKTGIRDLIKLLFYGHGKTSYMGQKGYVLYGPITKGQKLMMNDGYNGFGTIKGIYSAYEKAFFIPEDDLDFKFDGKEYEISFLKNGMTINHYCLETLM